VNHPHDLTGDDLSLLARLYQDYQDAADKDEFLRRAAGKHPDLAAALADMIEAERVLGGDERPSVPGYEILGELGRGGMGVVYKARQVSLDRVVALKVLRGGSATAEELARFRVEARALARVQHPNVVQVFDLGEADGRPYLALEYVSGGSLRQHLTGVPQPPRAAAELVEQVARGVEAIHQAGIVHRDLKPGNVLLQEDLTPGRKDAKEESKEDQAFALRSTLAGLAALRETSFTPKVADFGLARFLAADGDVRTATGVLVGTAAYVAPEQAAGDRDAVSPRTDVWALGVLLYELLTGRPPFQGSSTLDTLEMLRTQDPVPPRSLVPRVPEELERVCLRCLRKDPARRYPSAAAVASELGRFLQRSPTEEPLARQDGGRPAWSWGVDLAFAGLVAFVLLGALVLLIPDPPATGNGIYASARGLFFASNVVTVDDKHPLPTFQPPMPTGPEGARWLPYQLLGMSLLLVGAWYVLRRGWRRR
jgi:serine/threonine protein kinase